MTNEKRTPQDTSGDKPKTGAPGKSGYRKFTFLAPYLDANDKLWLRDNIDNYGSVVCLLLEQCTSTLRLSLKFDDGSSRFLAVLFDDSGDVKQPGTALSVRGATAADAIYALAYLHCYKLSDGWAAEIDPEHIDPWG